MSGSGIFERYKEEILWLLISVWVFSVRPSTENFLSICFTAFVSCVAVPRDPMWRTTDGFAMSMALLPSLLNEVLGMSHAVVELYVGLTIFWIFSFLRTSNRSVDVLFTSKNWVFALLIAVKTQILGWWIAIYFSIYFYPPVKGVWTAGEWQIVTALFTIFVVHFLQIPLIPVVWILGSTSALGQMIQIKWYTRLVLMILITWVVLTYLEYPSYLDESFDYPLLRELIKDHLDHSGSLLDQTIALLLTFFRETEEPSVAWLPLWPRYVWVVYWMVVIAVTVPLATKLPTKSVVIRRKWFHLVALLLFAPVSCQAPMLQSLGYAVAMALLVVVELWVRPNVGYVKTWYEPWLDLTKEKGDQIVVSHLSLIGGCALPLWLLPKYKLWGVWSLGIGDALAAVIGKTWGKRKWPASQRTLEGSVGFLLTGFAAQKPLVVVTAMLVEACTSQMDNIVLPLVGIVLLGTLG